MDAFAVSVSNGMMTHDVRLRHGAKMGLFCGVFQFVMPFLGWVLGGAVSGYIEQYDHWIAFILLGVIGGKMIWSYFQKDEEEDISGEAFGFKRLTILALATSIDALAVGVSFAVLNVDILLACTVIGIVAFIMSMAGVLLGKTLGPRLKGKSELLGGIILVGIGIRILFEHLS